MTAREGDLIETQKGLIFDVKGLVHPLNRIIAYIRYLPDEKGNRKRKVLYSKIYSLPDRYRFLKINFPNYLVYDPVFDETLCEVPIANVRKMYEPTHRLQEMRNAEKLDTLETKALNLAELVRKKAAIAADSIGVSGSILVKLHVSNSDIDLVIYGSENCLKVYSALKSLLAKRETLLKSYDGENLKCLFDFRSKDTRMSFEDFVRTESKKAWQGKFMDTDYFIRFVKDWDETDEKYGDITYRNCGYAKIEATVADDSESIFTPCKYKIKDVKFVEGTEVFSIEEIASFRGRFCEQARTGERVVAQGKIEMVTDARKKHEYCRLLLGNKLTDYMILKV